MGVARIVLCKDVLIVLSCSPVPRGFSFGFVAEEAAVAWIREYCAVAVGF